MNYRHHCLNCDYIWYGWYSDNFCPHCDSDRVEREEF